MIQFWGTLLQIEVRVKGDALKIWTDVDVRTMREALTCLPLTQMAGKSGQGDSLGDSTHFYVNLSSQPKISSFSMFNVVLADV